VSYLDDDTLLKMFACARSTKTKAISIAKTMLAQLCEDLLLCLMCLAICKVSGSLCISEIICYKYAKTEAHVVARRFYSCIMHKRLRGDLSLNLMSSHQPPVTYNPG
jgi:hypothetical protein